MHVLLVEDNPGDAELLEMHLRHASLSWTLEHVQRLDAAGARVAVQRPDVVLLDLSLPDAQGLDTVRRALEVLPDVPVVVLSGQDDDELATLAVHAGAQDYLVKEHVDGPMLMRSIRYAIERMQLERERKHLLELERAARDRAEDAVRARDRALQVFSHDLGNHLAAIQLYASLLLRNVSERMGPPGPRDWARGILEIAGELQALRENILDAAQIEAGGLSLAPQAVDPEELMEWVREHILPLAEKKGISLVVRSAGELPPLQADRHRVLQALGNLVGNAIKFSPPGGEISLRAEGNAREVRLAVADTGPGIAAEDLPQIFKSFWKSGVGNPQGAGLGLAIVKGIVEMHGGRIQVETELGRGTTFVIALPTDGRAPTAGSAESRSVRG